MDRNTLKIQLTRVIERAAAVLIIGPPGIGKRFVVHEVLGEKYPDDYSRIKEGDHPDILDLDGTSMKVDQAREVKSLTYRRPAALEYRFVMMRAVDQLNPTCAALMLKTMEDCPPKTRWLLTAHRLDRLLPTIKSRSFTLRLSPLPSLEIEKILSGLSRPAERARWAEGNIRWAQSVDTDELEEWDLWWSRMYTGKLKTVDLVKGIKKIEKEDYDPAVAVQVGTLRMALAIRQDPVKWHLTHVNMVQLVRDLEAGRAPRWWIQAWMVMVFRTIRGKGQQTYQKISRNAKTEA